jgi:hypothetical protein
MVRTAFAPSLEVRFADFLDSWKARWRYEPRWPTGECATGGSPQFRVWLPMLHPARKFLGKAFFVELEARSAAAHDRPGELPVYGIEVEDAGPDGEPVFLFHGSDGRVCLRAS